MIRHFFLDKTNTILEKTNQNFGLNPILSLSYGNGLSRGLIHFDMDKIKSLIEDKTFADTEKIKFTLKMTNCFSVDAIHYDGDISCSGAKSGERASSCDIMLFELPCDFDGGRGYEFNSDFLKTDKRFMTNEGSTWKNARSGFPWKGAFEYLDETYNPKDDHGGIYPINKLEEEYNKYLNNEESIIVGKQHIDFGKENLSIDITKYVLKCLKTGNNHGLCLSFTPYYENLQKDKSLVLNFFTDHTNTFFHPYIEAKYENYITDNRESFIIGQENKLYLYVYDEGQPVNLDKLPKCSIDEFEFEVKQAEKGVYYAIISPNILNMKKDMIYYDIWSEIVLNGVYWDDIEMEFVAHSPSRKISIGNNSNVKSSLVPYLSGINDSENISIQEIREINVDFREKYNTETKKLINKAEYRLYVKDGEREYTVIDFQPIEMGFLNNFFMLYTEDLIPNKYFIDIIIKSGRENLMFKDVLHFNIVNNITERHK